MAVDLTGSQSEVVGSATESLSTTEDLPECTNSNVGSDVDTSSNGGGSSVDPVGIIRSEFLEGCGLDDISPLKYRFNHIG